MGTQFKVGGLDFSAALSQVSEGQAWDTHVRDSNVHFLSISIH